MYNTYIHVNMYMNINEFVSWITNYSFRAVCCRALQCIADTATPCNTLQHTAVHCTRSRLLHTDYSCTIDEIANRRTKYLSAKEPLITELFCGK